MRLGFDSQQPDRVMKHRKHQSNKYSNRNENLVTKQEIEDIKLYFKDFQYKKYFKFLCTLHPDPEKERLEIVNAINKKDFNIHTKSGLVYVLVMDNKIIKVGSTITPFQKRVSSYNTGKTRYRISGKNSTTNYFCLQSFLKINKNIDVYVFFPQQETADIFGVKKKIEPNPKHWEREILTKLTEQGNKPIFCTQR